MSRTNTIYTVHQAYTGEWCFSEPRCVSRVMEKFDDALESWRVGARTEADRALRAVIKQCPIHIDALHHLALMDDERGLEEEAYWLERAAAMIGLAALGPEWEFSQRKLPWGFLENRPFLRAYHGYALSLMRRQNTVEARGIFENILATNPNDNQGIRYILPELLFQAREPSRVLALCADYPDDIGAAILYGKALALVQLERPAEAQQAMEVAIAHDPLVALELTKKRHAKPISLMSGYITVGGADAAYEYWSHYGKCWDKTPAALELLKDTRQRALRDLGTVQRWRRPTGGATTPRTCPISTADRQKPE